MGTVSVNPDKILLENIFLLFEQMRPFSKNEAEFIVGGEKKLERLIIEGKIDMPTRQSDKKGSVWGFNNVQILKHCRNMRKGTKRKIKTQ